MYVLLPRTNQETLTHLQVAMDKYGFGTPEYEKARKIYAWLCNKIRFESRVQAESIS